MFLFGKTFNADLVGKPCHWSGGEKFIGILVFYKLSRKSGLFSFGFCIQEIVRESRGVSFAY